MERASQDMLTLICLEHLSLYKNLSPLRFTPFFAQRKAVEAISVRTVSIIFMQFVGSVLKKMKREKESKKDANNKKTGDKRLLCSKQKE